MQESVIATIFLASLLQRIRSGSTAVTALFHDNKLHVSWLGDSQALLVRAGRAVEVMEPHRPEVEVSRRSTNHALVHAASCYCANVSLQSERKRIEEAGGFVLYLGTWRVNGTLGVSRAFGE